MRVMLAGGGTGGHLFPGLAVAREFQKRDGKTEIIFVGTQQGIEFRVIPKEGFRLETLTVKGMKGRGLRGLLDALVGVPASVLRSLSLISEFRPDCIIGLGGYASGPLLLAAKLKRVRSAIMEQNLRPGFTNKHLARWVDRVFTTYRDSAEYLPGAHVVEAGNPVRWQKLPQVARRNKFSLFVFGGSGGARRINFAVVEALQKLTDLQNQLFIRHQTGQADHAAIKAAYEKLPFEAAVTPFIDKMDEAFAQADLTICRSGASTVAELTVSGKAAILVPFPYAIYDHQRGNAEALEKEGAAEMILDQELSGERLAQRIRHYFSDRAGLEKMATAAKALGRPDAAARIVDECYALVGA
ncbi:MAG: undecaprenyldiphospho-muramoylpentapeptide beta-N-acetylglucosaminyltransferase [Deltaproteobacteria bacterium]|nr:undecaprenyldiphospho-muramoylpentapeptide beta-N-acetylglucosaminyltransferase [Deltaproteobacteria bacterium]MBM4299275.1 undecaprenyldiphospho-muramoylpentapeptide beta-N-acetylglucosaminyltransferase [Deltaproteobacteria bacterium]